MSNISDPAEYAAAVTLDADILSGTGLCRAIYVGGAGNLSLRLKNGADVVFTGVPVGIFPVRASRVNTTGTTATNLVALW